MIVEPRPPAPVLDAIRAPFRAAAQEGGAVRIEPGAVQPLNLLLDLLGEAMRARLLVVQTNGAEACLRPDFTVPVAREHLARSGGSGGGAARYVYEGPAFRAAPPGSDRAGEFLQIGLEATGETERARADAETAALAWHAATAGGRKDLELLMGDLGLFEAFCAGLGVAARVRARLKARLGAGAAWTAELERPPQAERAGRLAAWVSTLPEAQAAEVVSELWATGGLRSVGGRTAADVARRLSQRDGERESLSEGQRRWLERWTKIDGRPAEALEAIAGLAREAGAEMSRALEQASDRFARLRDAGVPADRQRLCAGFGRPFGYYDGFLFEVRSAALPADEPVAAGGRYDGLLGRLQPGADAPAVGCMVRPYRAWSGAAA